MQSFVSIYVTFSCEKSLAVEIDSHNFDDQDDGKLVGYDFTDEDRVGEEGSQEKGRPLPKFGEWDVNDPASAEGFTVIFNKARNEKKTGGKPDSPEKDEIRTFRQPTDSAKPQSDLFSSFKCCGYEKLVLLYTTISRRVLKWRFSYITCLPGVFGRTGACSCDGLPESVWCA
ncbi:hypothetical protein IFM89_039775 [Coptis chinensis]|uniref:RIN4 pathogenic type III effector avirulence factor Avr cleavage site domain-containing protein n=1 Tax=Coptis chinensis TaxID=261450 RepID=A0A835GSU0_9MAGN|nr:hypothetical protein IFM89_039775 [Coptis chinensis]